MNTDSMNFNYLESVVLGILIISYPDIVGGYLPWALTIASLLIIVSIIGIFLHYQNKLNYWQILSTICILQFLWSYFLYLIIRYNLNHHLAWVLVMFTVVVLCRGIYAAYIDAKKYLNLQEDLHALNKLKKFQEDSKNIDWKKLKK